MTGATMGPEYLSPETRGAILRDAMRWRGLTVASVAESLGVHRTTVARWYQAADVDGLRRVARVVGLDFVRVSE